MDKADFENKIDTLINRASKRTKKKALFLFKNGGLDTDKYPNNFLLPMLIMAVVFLELSDAHKPPYEPEKTEFKKLSHFHKV